MVSSNASGTEASGRIAAVVLAGGLGHRMRADRPKQLLELAGKPILQHSIEAFAASPAVDEVLVMVPEGQLATLVDQVSLWGATGVQEGGVFRHDTVRIALDALGADVTGVLLHDAARPLLSQELIAACVGALDDHQAAGVFVDSADTVVEVSDDGSTVAAVPDRRRLRRAQTPQAFDVAVIRRAHALAADDPAFEPTDDCGVVARYLPQVPIAVIPGESRNLKVTEPLDLLIAERLLKADE